MEQHQHKFEFDKPPNVTLRDAGVEQVIRNTPDDYRSSFRKVLGAMAADGRQFTSEDVTAVVGLPPNNHNTVGALFLGAAKKGIIRKCGYRQSVRPERHAAVIALWEGQQQN